MRDSGPSNTNLSVRTRADSCGGATSTSSSVHPRTTSSPTAVSPARGSSTSSTPRASQRSRRGQPLASARRATPDAAAIRGSSSAEPSPAEAGPGDELPPGRGDATARVAAASMDEVQSDNSGSRAHEGDGADETAPREEYEEFLAFKRMRSRVAAPCARDQVVVDPTMSAKQPQRQEELNHADQQQDQWRETRSAANQRSVASDRGLRQRDLMVGTFDPESQVLDVWLSQF